MKYSMLLTGIIALTLVGCASNDTKETNAQVNASETAAQADDWKDNWREIGIDKQYFCVDGGQDVARIVHFSTDHEQSWRFMLVSGPKKLSTLWMSNSRDYETLFFFVDDKTDELTDAQIVVDPDGWTKIYDFSGAEDGETRKPRQVFKCTYGSI